MKSKLSTIIKIIVLTIIVGWVVLVFVEYFRVQDEKDLLITVSEEVIDYEDGAVYVYHGLGYKLIKYERTSLKAREFGPFYTKVREP